MADLKWPQRRPTGGIFLSDAFHPMKESEKTRLKQCRMWSQGRVQGQRSPRGARGLWGEFIGKGTKLGRCPLSCLSPWLFF